MKKFDYPFKIVFSLVPLINFWKKIEARGNAVEAEYARRINEELKKAPELFEPIEDYSVLEKYKDLIDSLMNAVFSPASKQFDLYAALGADELYCFYQTPKFKELNLFENKKTLYNLLIDTNTMHACTVIGSYALILNRYYGVGLNYEFPLIYQYKDKVTGLDRWVRIRMLGWFTELKKLGEIVPFSEEDKKILFENLTNLEVLKQLIPSDNFEMHGFMIFNAVDITDQQLISSMKYDLMEKDVILSSGGSARLQKLQDKFRALLRTPGLQLGLVSLPVNSTLNDAYPIGQSFILNETCLPKIKNYKNSLYDRALKRREVMIIRDLNDLKAPSKPTVSPAESGTGSEEQSLTPIEECIINQGMRNLYLAPLIQKDELVGIMELGSPNPGDLNKVNTLKLNEVLTLFATCIKTGMEDLNKSIQSVIKEKCTAIHPSVEWRFRKAAMDYLKKSREEMPGEEMEDIRFEEVYPLYGVSDIRDSSRFRNATIQADLIDNLNLANEIIITASKYEKLPILDELSSRISLQVKEIGMGLSSSDEANILGFLHTEVESLFSHIEKYGKDVSGMIQKYYKVIDPKLRFLYRKRKEFDECVTLINEAISAELDHYEILAQKMFPHYFEKYKTDGVEHTMYIGASLTESKEFNIMYLKNLRLWQIMMLCGIVKKCKALKDELKVPLETTHLILVQNTPLAICFQYDEKKFDVDGTYNIRYEIMKKRIDKAEIKGTGERLTQPGKIAFVYSQDSEAAEYKLYIDYLNRKGSLLDDAEYLDLQDLQGVHGLTAIRVSVNTKSPSLDSFDSDVILKEAKKLISS